MNIRSSKAKGQRAAKEVQERLLAHCSELSKDDVRVTPGGVNGADIQLSSKGKEILPFAWEVKNQERLNIWGALQQAESHVESEEIPIVAFKRNRSKIYVAVELDRFLEVVYGRGVKN